MPGPRTALRYLSCALAAAALGLSPAAVATADVPAWLTYDHDAARTATDPDSTAPVTPTLAWGAAAQLDGQVFAQPLVYGSLVYVATENDTIYALDAASGAVVWARSVGAAVPAADLPCGDILPTVGITGTPVIDPSTGRIYAVADQLVDGVVRHELVALDVDTGDPVAGFPIDVDPPGADPTAVLQRAAPTLDSGRVIVPYGGNSGDCGNYHGWLVSAPADGAGPNTSFEVDPNPGDHGGAMWGAGDGPSQDAAGHLFAATGNGFSSASTPDLQESVIELDPTLDMLDHWTASNWQTLDSTDADLGSSQPLPLPDGLLFQIGKDNVGRLLDADALGTTGQVFSAPVCDAGGAYGAALYRSGVIYVPCTHGIVALALSLLPTPSLSPEPGWTITLGTDGPPVLAGGLVWSTGWRGSDLLYGLDPATGAIVFETDLGAFNHFATPSAGGGRLFVAAGSRVLAFTIAELPAATSATPTAPSSRPSPAGAPVSPTASAVKTPPRLSRVRLSPRRFTARRGTTLILTLSEAARVRIAITRIRTGHRHHHRCRLTARHGRRCTLRHRVRTLALNARTGHNRLHLSLRRLAAGSYAASVVARTGAGPQSRVVTVSFRIKRPRH